jgi:hypothetical protein
MPVQIDDLEALCAHVEPSTPLSVTFPGGVQISAMIGVDKGDARAKTQALAAYVNAALAPLTPLLNTVDLVVAMKDVVTGNLDAIPTVIQKAGAVAGIPLAVPAMIKGILLMIVETVLALLTELEAIAEAQAEIAAAMTEAEQPGNEILLATLECEAGNLDVEIQNQAASMGPLNSIISLVNTALATLTGQQLDPFGDVADASTETLAAIRASLEVVQQVASILPG